MKFTRGTNGKLVVSLCDYSGNWPKPWADKGYSVACFDLKHGDDVTDLESMRQAIDALCYVMKVQVDTILAAPPCTDFSVSGAQYWPKKDADGTTAKALQVLDACYALADHYRPRVFALENPVGRIPKLRPQYGKPVAYFHPHEYAGYGVDEAEVEANRYTKKTGLWGWGFKMPLKINLEPIRYCKQGSWLQQLGGKSDRTKELRSMTPMAFARAFLYANG